MCEVEGPERGHAQGAAEAQRGLEQAADLGRVLVGDDIGEQGEGAAERGVSAESTDSE